MSDVGGGSCSGSGAEVKRREGSRVGALLWETSAGHDARLCQSQEAKRHCTEIFELRVPSGRNRAESHVILASRCSLRTR